VFVTILLVPREFESIRLKSNIQILIYRQSTSVRAIYSSQHTHNITNYNIIDPKNLVELPGTDGQRTRSERLFRPVRFHFWISMLGDSPGTVVASDTFVGLKRRETKTTITRRPRLIVSTPFNSRGKRVARNIYLGDKLT